MCPHCIAMGLGAVIAAVPVVKFIKAKIVARASQRHTR